MRVRASTQASVSILTSEYADMTQQTILDDEADDTFNFHLILTALIILSDSESNVKSLTICEYYTNKTLIRKRPNGSLFPRYRYPIREAHNAIKDINIEEQYQMREQKQLKSIFLSPKALKTILSVVVNVSLCLVPIFASDDYI